MGTANGLPMLATGLEREASPPRSQPRPTDDNVRIPGWLIRYIAGPCITAGFIAMVTAIVHGAVQMAAMSVRQDEMVLQMKMMDKKLNKLLNLPNE